MPLKIFSRFSFGEIPNSVRQKVEMILREWQAMQLDGVVTPQEFLDFSRNRIEDLMAAVEALRDGATKKAIVLEAAGAAFDYFAPKIVGFLPWYLAWLRWVIAAPGSRELFLLGVSNLIEIVFVEKFKLA